MGRASISIAITSNFNPRGIDAAIAKMEKLAVQSTSLHGRFGKDLVDSGAALGVASAQLEKWGKSVAALGDRLTMGVTVPMGIAAGASVVAATKIDTAWYNVRKTVDMTEEGYERLRQSAMDLAATQPVDAETLLNIEALGGQLGITNPYLEDFARIVSGLDISTNMDSSTAAQELAQFRNIVQMSEGDLENWASTVVDLGNHTATTEADMVNLAMRFASAGHIAGMSNAEILGLSAALSGLGMRAEAGGSAISRTINDINNSVATGGENLQKWADLVGKTPEQFSEAWRAAPMDEFLDVLQNINNAGSDMGAVLEDLGITQIRQSDAMRRLASSGEYVSEVVERANRAWEQNTALTQEVEKRNESLESRFKTIGNRLVNTAATFGEPVAEMVLRALDALDPLVQGVGDAANAFADADPMVQQFAFNLGLVAAAAGPVLSITGRLMQGAGNLGKNIARVMQQYGTYTEALNTNDAAMIRNFTEQRTLATRLGLSRNAAVKAAGGVDQFRRNLEVATPMVRAEAENARRAEIYTSAYADAVANGATSHEEASRAAAKEVNSKRNLQRVTKAGTEAVKGMTAEQVNAIAASERGQAALEREGNTVSKTTSKFTALKSVLLGLGGMAAMAALGAGITWVATQLSEAERHTNLFRDATKGLSDAVGDATVHLGSEAQELAHAGERTSNVAQLADACFESQSKLAESIRETGQQANAQIGTLNQAKGVIEQYANQSDLNAYEQYQLKDAIDKVNEACGTQYSVVDASQGKIADESGTIQENTDKILENIEARKRQIQLETYQDQWDQLYQQHLENEEALGTIYAENKEAIDKGNAAYERRAKLMEELDKYPTDSPEYGRILSEITECNDALDETYNHYREIEQADKGVTDQMETLQERIRDVSGATDEATSKIASFLQEAGKQALFDKTGQDMEAFAAACESVGIRVSDLESLSRPVLDKLVSEFDGSMESIVRSLKGTEEGRQALEKLGISIDDFLAKFQDSDKFQKAFDFDNGKIAEFAAACERAKLNFGALNQFSSEQIAELARNFDGSIGSIVSTLETFGDTGRQIIDQLGANWREGFGETTQGAIDALTDLGVYSEAELMVLADKFRIGGDAAVRAFVDSLRGGLDPSQAAEIATLVANGMTVVEAFQQAGLTDTQAYIDAINSQQGNANAAGQNVGNSAAEGEASTSPQHYSAGNVDGRNYGVGVESTSGGANAAGAKIGSSAAQGESSANPQHNSAGVGGGTNYANGLSSQSDNAYSAGESVAGQAASGLQSYIAAAYGWGAEMASNFAAGVGAGSRNVQSAATNMAFSAAHLLRHSIPKSGPFKRDDLWGQHLAENFAAGMTRGLPQVERSALALARTVNAILGVGPSSGSYGVSSQSTASRARTVAYGAVSRVSASGTDAYRAGATVASRALREADRTRAASPSIDYDTLYRVTESAVANAIRKSGGLSPVVELDGRRVSRQLVNYLDSDFNRLRQMRG